MSARQQSTTAGGRGSALRVRDSGRWYCNGCNEHIDEPTTREEKQPGGRYGLSKALAEADKEAWP